MMTITTPASAARPSSPAIHPVPVGTLSSAEIRRIILDVLG
jgi:hypothetical protein